VLKKVILFLAIFNFLVESAGVSYALRPMSTKASPKQLESIRSKAPEAPSETFSLDHKKSSSGGNNTHLEDDSVFIDEVLKYVPSQVHQNIRTLFQENMEYFNSHPGSRTSFLKRLKKFSKRYHSAITLNLFDDDALLSQVLFLIIVRGTIKDLVWVYGERARNAMEGLGINPQSLFNIFEPTHIQKILDEVLASGLLNAKDMQFINDEIEWATGFKLKTLKGNDLLLSIFTDQIAIALRLTLLKLNGRLKDATPKKESVESHLEKLAHDTYGDLRFEISNRSFDYLKGGKRAGDCTAPGSFNYWSAGIWNAYFENSEINIYYKNQFFARLVFTIGNIEDSKPAIWVHAIEFSPLCRPSRSSDESVAHSTLASRETKKLLLSESFGFLSSFAQRSGIQSAYCTTITNSSEFYPFVQSLLPATSIQTIGFNLLTPLVSAHNLQRNEFKASVADDNHRIPIYLQGWRSVARFAIDDSFWSQEEADPLIMFAGEKVERDLIERASRLLVGHLNERVEEICNQVGEGMPLNSTKIAISKTIAFLRRRFAKVMAFLPEQNAQAFRQTVERIEEKAGLKEIENEIRDNAELKYGVELLTSIVSIISSKAGISPSYVNSSSVPEDDDYLRDMLRDATDSVGGWKAVGLLWENIPSGLPLNDEKDTEHFVNQWIRNFVIAARIENTYSDLIGDFNALFVEIQDVLLSTLTPMQIYDFVCSFDGSEHSTRESFGSILYDQNCSEEIVTHLSSHMRDLILFYINVGGEPIAPPDEDELRYHEEADEEDEILPSKTPSLASRVRVVNISSSKSTSNSYLPKTSSGGLNASAKKIRYNATSKLAIDSAA